MSFYQQRTRCFLCCVMFGLSALPGCGGGSTPEKTFAKWSNAVNSKNFAEMWTCLTPESRGTILQILVLDSDLLAEVNPNAKASFQQVYSKHGLDPQAADFASRRLSTPKSLELAADLEGVFQQYKPELDKISVSRYTKVAALWSASAQASLSSLKIEGPKATAAVSGKLPRVPEGATVQASFSKQDGRWLLAELEPSAMEQSAEANDAGSNPATASIAMANVFEGLNPTLLISPPTEVAQATPNATPPVAESTPPVITPPATPNPPNEPPKFQGRLFGGGDDPDQPPLQQPNPGKPASPPPEDEQKPAATPDGETPADKKEGDPPAGFPAGNPGIFSRNGENQEGGLNGLSPQGNNGVVAANPHKEGSLDFVLTEFINKIKSGNLEGMDQLISSRAKGLLANIRDGELDEDRKKELQDTFSTASSQQGRRKSSGANFEVYLTGKEGQVLHFTLIKENANYIIRDLRFVEPKKRR